MIMSVWTDFPERFDNMTEILVADRQDWKKFEMVITGQAGGRPIIKLKGIDSPEQASRMVNRELAVTRRQLTELPAGRYFIFDLIGMEVVTHETGASVGRLVDVRQWKPSSFEVMKQAHEFDGT